MSWRPHQPTDAARPAFRRVVLPALAIVMAVPFGVSGLRLSPSRPSLRLTSPVAALAAAGAADSVARLGGASLADDMRPGPDSRARIGVIEMRHGREVRIARIGGLYGP